VKIREKGKATIKGSTRGMEASTICYETLEEFARGKVQQFVQEILEEEVTTLLGREKSERRKGIDQPVGCRNGYGK
jgi:hypothetical protein